jgi:hypothetical protein
VLDFTGSEADFEIMQKLILPAMLLIAVSPQTFAASYPVSGKWGESASANKGTIDCATLRVIEFNGAQRTDSKGGVPAYRIKSISANGPSRFRVVDEFTTGQINNARLNYTLTQIDADHIEMNMTPGGILKMQRCK